MPTLTYYGHSAFRINDATHAVFIDPFLRANPLCKTDPKEIRKCDYILLTHAHADHYGDTEVLARAHGATIVCTWELAQWFQKRGLKAHGMAAGGGFDFPFGRVGATIAFHGCGADPAPDGSMPPPNSPIGFVVHWGKSRVLYHAGDTALFSDMKLIGEKYNIDVACVPIGDNFTMGIDDASRAVEWLNPAKCVPMHYNTFDLIKADALAFSYRIAKQGKKCMVMNSGDVMDF